MGKLLDIVTPLHKRTKRNYIDRMVDEKVHCMLKAKEYEYDYWESDHEMSQRIFTHNWFFCLNTGIIVNCLYGASIWPSATMIKKAIMEAR